MITPSHGLRLAALAALLFQSAVAASWTPVRPADLASLEPALFSDEELDLPAMAGPNRPLPYYLKHFHRVANAVVGDGPERGFIRLSVWRRERDNLPHNARVMENILSLAFFYTADRPWNPYRGDPAVRTRLEAALEFWIRIQNDDGRFSEYAPERWNLAATAFATKFMGETLLLLRDGPAIDPDLLRRVVAAQRRAILAVLTRDDLYTHGMRFSNQYVNVWAGALAHLELKDDPEVARLLARRMDQALGDFISPAGFFFEQHGPDWGYAFGTHHSNLAMAWHHARGTPFAEPLRIEQEKWAEWLAYNAPPEPDLARFFLNRAIETRQRRSHLDRLETPLAEVVPMMRAYAPTDTEVEARRARIRTEVARDWPQVAALDVGQFTAFSPYAFLHRRHVRWWPTDAERQAALADLPILRADRFVHQRVDDRNPLVYTFVRRPAYYAAFNDVIQLGGRAPRNGLGLLWSPASGAFLQSQGASDTHSWGTRSGSRQRVHEAAPLTTEYRFAGHPAPWKPSPGTIDLPDGSFSISYPLGDRGRKTLHFTDDGVTVEVIHPGSFTEVLPLLTDAGFAPPATAGDAIRFPRNGQPVTIILQSPAAARWSEPRSHTPGVTLHALEIDARDRLIYRIMP